MNTHRGQPLERSVFPHPADRQKIPILRGQFRNWAEGELQTEKLDIRSVEMLQSP